MNQAVMDMPGKGLQRSGSGGRQVANQQLDNAATSDSFVRDEDNRSLISKHPNRCGGDACIRGSRIPVWVLENYRRLGGTDEQLFADYPSLTSADLEEARTYTANHQEEIDRADSGK